MEEQGQLLSKRIPTQGKENLLKLQLKIGIMTHPNRVEKLINTCIYLLSTGHI